MKPKVCAIIIRVHCLTPVEKVIVVNNSAGKIALAEYRDMIGVVVVSVGSHKPVDETRLPHTCDALLPLRARQTNHCYVKGSDWGYVHTTLSSHYS